MANEAQEIVDIRKSPSYFVLEARGKNLLKDDPEQAEPIFGQAIDILDPNDPVHERVNLLADLSHDLRSPMTFIYGYLSFLKSTNSHLTGLEKPYMEADVFNVINNLIRGRIIDLIDIFSVHRMQIALGISLDTIQDVGILPEKISPESLIAVVLRQVIPLCDEAKLICSTYFKTHPTDDQNIKEYQAKILNGPPGIVEKAKYIFGAYTGDYLIDKKEEGAGSFLSTAIDWTGRNLERYLGMSGAEGKTFSPIGDYHSGDKLWVDVPTARLAFQSLLENMIISGQFSPDIGLQQEGSQLLITVTDKTRNITDQKAQDLLGDQDLSKSEMVKQKNIPLFLASQMAQANGGSLEVKTDGSGKGISFVLKLPLVGEMHYI